ncbi:MAG: DUF4832 domain-containing protein [Paludibacteraceae bacterium]|nr:DUF4832 domain-containing protein [Paludibacteraceae bacterium]
MKKLVFSALTLGLLVAGAFSNSISAVQVSYTADNTSIFRNPERGFLLQLEKNVTATAPYNVKGREWFLEENAAQNQSLVLVLYYLDNFKTTATLPNEILNAFDEDMAVLRQYGFKCVLRFAYTNSASGEIGYDATPAIVTSHISQLASHLQANADVIYTFEAGFVGSWGEWYYTSNFGNKSQDINADRRAVIDALLAAVPTDRCVMLRYPCMKIQYLNNDANPLTETEAYQNTSKARLAHHNDAFLNNWGDCGTYYYNGNDDSPAMRQYIADETLYVPNGGETNVESSSLANTNCTYEKTIAACSTYHWSFCKGDYAEATTNKWRTDGTYAEMEKKLGYRYELVTATLPAQAAIGGTANVNIQIKNVGFAPIYNERHVYLVLKNGSQSYSIQLQSDPRRWLPNDAVTTINEQITIPTSVPEGTYQMYLHMPDKYASLASDPRFSVRFANTGVWDATTGMNSLNASVTIVSSGTVIPTTPTINVQTEVAFAGVTVGAPAIQQIAVSGNDLEGIVNINSDNAALTVNPTSLTSNEVQSGILVTLTLTATTAGNGNATLTFSSVNAVSKTVNVTWNATSGGGGEDPGPSTPDQGQYSTRVYNADSTVCTWNFQDVVSADATINTETTDNGIIYRPASGGKIKIIAGASNGLSTQKTQSTVCIPVPAGSAGTISATMYGNSDSRYFQLYVNGTASSSDKRIWSKYNATPTSDGKKGPQSFTFTESDLTKIGDNYYLVLTDNTTEMKVATFTVTLTTGSYAVGGGEQGGEGGGGDTPTPPSTDAVELPATLNKANVNAVSSDMTYWQTDYFDFGPTDAENIGRWAEWKVYLRYPGKYIISVVNGFPGDDNADGNTWQLELLNGSTSVSIFTGENLWAQAQYTYSAKWDLSAKAVGEYTLRVKNTAAWEQPKLRSVTLQYDGVLPTGLEDVMLDMNAPMYDVLGRKVGADYRGVVIQNGKAFLK